jgi:hypothetical protein
MNYMVTLPSGNKVSESFLQRFNDGFLCEADCEVILTLTPADLHYIKAEWLLNSPCEPS